MSFYGQDPGTESLLDLDGQILVLDAKGSYSVKFSVQRVERSPQRPHGLNHSLTLHGPQAPDGRCPALPVQRCSYAAGRLLG
jgi:hypothetical protein